MNIEILFKAPLRGWQQRLACKLRQAGHAVCLKRRPGRDLGAGVAVALSLQKLAFGPRKSLFDVAELDSGGSVGGGTADLAIVLDGGESEAARILEPLFDNGRGHDALISALAGKGSPTVRIKLCSGETETYIATYCLAVEDREILSRGLDQVLARIVTLIVQAVRRVDEGSTHAPVSAPSTNLPSRPLTHMARGSIRKLLSRASGARRGPNHWRVGYRPVGPEHDNTQGELRFSIVPDDGGHFYADPMPFEHEGRIYLFVEDFPYATGKGVIVAFEFGAAGNLVGPRTVLEQACHLSYPFIIRHGNDIYMLPEMSGAQKVQLFKADPFPDRWVPDRILLDDIIAADATLIQHDGRWWMFATLSDDGGSSWDQLCLFHAPDLFGPWTAHADNSVLVDAGCARPAGAMWHENGVLMRVAQDCRGGYGVGLAVCRVDRLDPRGYQQTVVERLGPPEGYGADGFHTRNRTGRLEVIDLRFPAAARLNAPSRQPAALPSPARG